MSMLQRIGADVAKDLLERPTPCFRLPRMTRKLGLGGSFGLAWGDGTYGELGGAVMDFGGWPLTNRSFTDPQALPVPGKVTLPRHTQDKEGEEGPKGVKDIACGERHSLLLDDLGNLYAFGENLAGQCGVLEAVGSGHIFGCTVQQPRPVPIEAASLSDVTPTQERGEKVFAGKVTADHRLYIWGHPSNRKLGHVGFNHDGTEAGEDPGIGAKQKSKARPPGVAVRSALRDAVRRPRMVFALLHRRVRTLGLGEECTVIVHGDGKEPDEQSQEVQDVQVRSEAIPDLEAALPVAEKESHPLEEAKPPKDFRLLAGICERFRLYDAVEKLSNHDTGPTAVSRLRRQLPEKPVICILGSTTFNDPKTEETNGDDI
eukprot:s2_g34.t1